jgi:O-antigen ligase
MPENRDSWLFAMTAVAAAAVLVSIAAAEILLTIAFVAWLTQRQRPIVWPSYFLPLSVFMATTVLSLIMSPEPQAGWPVIRKFVLFAMGLLAANTVTSVSRAAIAHRLLLVVAAAASLLAVVQFGIAYSRFSSTHQLADDPTVLARVTGFMGHWMTFSGELLLVWCAAIPALLFLRKRWMIPLGLVGTAVVLSFTRSAWIGAGVGLALIAVILPRKTLVGVMLPIAIVAAAVSGLIYHRLALSFQGRAFGPDTGRVELFLAGVKMVKEHPLFGVGPERIRTEFPHYYRWGDVAAVNFFYGHLENNILQIAAERGLLCLSSFLWFIFELYASLLRMLRKAGHARWAVLSALSALTGFIVAGLFSYNFGDSEILLLLLFVVSLPFGMGRAVPVEDPYPANLIPTVS